MIDIHVHFGHFYDNYLNPDQVIQDLVKMGVSKVGLMPTLTRNGDNVLESHEKMKDLLKKYKDRIIPILWIHPTTKEKVIYGMLKELPYKIIKIHGYFHNWHLRPISLQRIIDIARKINLTVMFHTGGRKESYAFAYKKICKNNPDITFILAHSRPVKGTINIMKECQNVYCDISFTPIKDVLLLIENNLTERMLWGTDYPVYIAFNPEVDINQWYQNRYYEVIAAIGKKKFEAISEVNILNVIG
jgi:predicted TIM-barrel fold metal-dependent hydrolase